jgi:hypothetical protein
MQRHPYFALWLHDDDELAALVGSPIARRTTIHEWPLSCVQRLECATEGTHIYKAQSPPTVEPTFYLHARSPLVVPTQVLLGDHGPGALLLENVQAPCLSDVSLAEPRALATVDDILAQIAQIAGDLPAMSDIRTSAQWMGYAQQTGADLRTLAEGGALQQVSATMIDQVQAHMRSPAVLAAINGPTGYVHGDLWAENVFVLADGYRVVDWQRPFWGPVALDRATLLESLGIDPVQHVSAGVLHLRRILLIGWYAQAARHWYPAGAASYDAQIAHLIQQLVA